MRRIRILLAYDGTEFHGWQVQPGRSTIQKAVQDVVSEIEGRPVAVHASGRTDAGVHALAQVAAFSIENPIPVENLKKAMNRLLPRSVRVLETSEAEPDFHPRFDATAKSYEYRIWRGDVCPPFLRCYTHHYPYPLDEAAMAAGAPLLEGEHDFTAFAAADEKEGAPRSKVRRILESRCERQGDLIVYRVRGSGFLKHMVRNIVGVLLEVGKGNLGPAELLARLEPASGIPAGPTAPARGLFLVSVEYGPSRLES